MSCLEIENLNVALSGKSILKDMALTVESGDFVGIIGPNGSGKSTLLKSIYRTIKPKSGTIYLDDKSIHQLPYKVTAQKMAVVGQHNDHAFDFTVYELVMMGRSPYKGFLEKDSKKDNEIVMNALDQVSLTGYEDRSYETLSGGEKQRVILARALSQESELLILDEPTNHLDVRHQLEIMEVVKNLSTTVMFAVHDLNIALMYCNKVCIIEKGRIIAAGKPKELITPEMIEQVYGVKSQIMELADGRLHVIYNAIV